MWTPPDQLRSPGVSEPTASPFRVLSQISVTWWALGHLWFSKLNVLGACLSGTCLKSWGDCCGVQTLPSSGRSSGFWVPSWLWIASQLVGFWWDYVPDFSTASTWVFSPIVCLVCRISQFLVSPQGPPPPGTCSILSCKFIMSVSGCEPRILLGCHLEQKPVFLIPISYTEKT